MSSFLDLAGVLFRRDGSTDDAAMSVLTRAVRHVARRWGKTPDEEEDLLHDLLLKLLVKRHSAEGGCGEGVIADEHKLFCSCVRVASNHLTDETRRTRRMRAEDPSVLDTRAGPEQVVLDVDVRELDLSWIGHPRAEEVMRRLLFQGQTVKEVSQAMGMSVEYVRTLRSLGVERLQGRVNRGSDDSPG